MILGAILQGAVQGLFGTSRRSSGRRSYSSKRRCYKPAGKSYYVYCRRK